MEEKEKIIKSSKYAKKIINQELFEPVRKNGKEQYNKLIIAISSIIHKYDYARKNIIYKNKQIKRLKQENKIIRRRLRHLLKSNTIKKYDEWDLKSNKYKLDIEELDKQYVIVYDKSNDGKQDYLVTRIIKQTDAADRAIQIIEEKIK